MDVNIFMQKMRDLQQLYDSAITDEKRLKFYHEMEELSNLYKKENEND